MRKFKRRMNPDEENNYSEYSDNENNDIKSFEIDINNTDDEDDFEYPEDEEYDLYTDVDYNAPEGYSSIEDEDEEFQSRMRQKGFKRYKPAVSGGYGVDWRNLNDKKPYSPIKSNDLPLDKYLKMKKEQGLDESRLHKIIKKVLKEEENQRYMFFSNLEQMKRQCEMLLKLDENKIEQILSNGHDWAQDHIAEAKNNMDQVFDFLMNETKSQDKGMVEEGRKKAGTKLCSRGLAAAKGKFKVHPSAYSNGYGVLVCKGKQPGLDGKKKCSPPYC